MDLEGDGDDDFNGSEILPLKREICGCQSV